MESIRCMTLVDNTEAGGGNELGPVCGIREELEVLTEKLVVGGSVI